MTYCSLQVGDGDAVGVGVGDGVKQIEHVGVGVAGGRVGVGVGARLNAPIRNRQTLLVVGMYSLTTQKVWSSTGSTSIDV
jgi:hypothetical protein